jgi:hypothetical protein
MAELVQSTNDPNVWLLRVDAHELACGAGIYGVIKLPYCTHVGTLHAVTGKVNVWTPAAYVPRGYRKAALALLEAFKAEAFAPGGRFSGEATIMQKGCK